MALIGLGTIVYFSCFNLSRVTSRSMSPTLRGNDWRTGDLVLAERISYWFRGPRRWEVIAFRSKDGVQVMKRVVGLPGERVQMQRDGQILIDGQPIQRPASLDFPKYFAYGNLINNQSADCGAGYYVLGDFTRDSEDSRFTGPVMPEQLAGRAWLILGPSGRRGFVNP